MLKREEMRESLKICKVEKVVIVGGSITYRQPPDKLP